VHGLGLIDHRYTDGFSVSQEIADGEGLGSIRDLAMISVLLGCGLRRAELSALEVDDLQIRQEHWAIVDLVGKGGHVRIVPMPLATQVVENWSRFNSS
jgi:site-specific recombinase XerC